MDGREVASNQYSVTEHLRHISVGSGRGLPGVWFFYEVDTHPESGGMEVGRAGARCRAPPLVT